MVVKLISAWLYTCAVGNLCSPLHNNRRYEQYYLLNTTDGQVIGPIVDERVFQDEVNTELGFQKIDFIATAPKPEGAIYYSEK